MPLIVIPNELTPPPAIITQVRPAPAAASPGGARTVRFVIPFAPNATRLGRAGRAAVQQLLPEAKGAAWITIIGQARKGPRGDGFFVAWERALTVKAELNKARVERARICDVIHEAAASRNAEVILTFPRAKATEVSKQ